MHKIPFFLTLLPADIGDGTSRSTAFQGCETMADGQCLPLGVDAESISSANKEADGDSSTDAVEMESVSTPSNSTSSGGGSLSFLSLLVLMLVMLRRRFSIH